MKFNKFTQMTNLTFQPRQIRPKLSFLQVLSLDICINSIKFILATDAVIYNISELLF